MNPLRGHSRRKEGFLADLRFQKLAPFGAHIVEILASVAFGEQGALSGVWYPVKGPAFNVTSGQMLACEGKIGFGLF